MSASPVAANRALTRSTRERPARSTIGPPAKRPTVIEAAKSANTREPIVAPKPCPSTMISGSQSLAVPSASAIASTTPPMHTSRTSFHSAGRGVALGGGDLPGPGRERAHRPDQQSRTDGGSEHEMGRNGEARGVGEDAEARTDHGAEAEAAVQGGEEGAPAELLDVGPFDVHG